MTRRAAQALLALALASGVATPLYGQMMLPGANNGNAVGAPPKAAGIAPSTGGGGSAPASLHPVTIKPPGTDTILGHELSRDGHEGAMVFDGSGGGLTLTRLRLAGDKISRPQQSCSLDVSVGTGLRATPGGEPDGTLRFDVPLETCPFTIDVLDGSVLVTRPDATCEFKQADCRVAPGGLWGPRGFEISSTRAAELEHERTRIETTMRTNFRALLKKAGKDKAAAKEIVRDQAAFSSEREMTCRDYDQESTHGFCSTQITKARALALLARYGTIEKPEKPRIASKPRPKPKKPAAVPVTAPTTPAAPPALAPPAAPAPR